MQPKQLFHLLLLITFLASCKGKNQQSATTETKTTYSQLSTESYPSSTSTTTEEKSPSYQDGNYCASVRYTNQHTGAESYYTLNIQVEDGKLVKVSFPNGGWLDATHFTPPIVSQQGFAMFTTDRGYQYEVIIKGSGSCSPSDTYYNTEASRTQQYYTSTNTDEDEETKVENKYGRYTAEVYKRISGCDYMILEHNGDYYVAEWMGGYDPDEGDVVQGNLHSFGTKTCYVKRNGRDSRLWIEDYSITLSHAWEIIRDKCDLKSDDDQ